MRILALCPKCWEVSSRRAAFHVVGAEEAYRRSSAPSRLQAADIRDGHLHLECDAGHPVEIPTQVPPHELHFELGCHFLLEGHYGEAVLKYAACFERFMEFASRVILVARAFRPRASEVTIEPLRPAAVEAWWKIVKKQTERQVGSYAALWVLAFEEAPPQPDVKLPGLDKEAAQLRNMCAHQGYFPLRKEAVAFGGGVLETIVGATRRLQEEFADHGLLAFLEHFADAEYLQPLAPSTLLEVNALSEHYRSESAGVGDPAIAAEYAAAAGPAERLEMVLRRVAERREAFWSG